MEEQLVGEIRGYMEALANMYGGVYMKLHTEFVKAKLRNDVASSLEDYYREYVIGNIQYEIDFFTGLGYCNTKSPGELKFDFELESIANWKEKFFKRLDHYFLRAFDDDNYEAFLRVNDNLQDRYLYEGMKSNCFNQFIKKIEKLLGEGETTVWLLNQESVKYYADGKQQQLGFREGFFLDWNHFVFRSDDRLYLIYFGFYD